MEPLTVWILIIIGVLGLVGTILHSIEAEKGMAAARQRLSPKAELRLKGTYLGGLKEASSAVSKPFLFVTGGDFILLDEKGAELGRISRKKIAEIQVDDKSRVFQRLSAIRIAFLGPFSLAAPLRETESSYVVAVVGDGHPRRAVLFEFQTMSQANTTASFLQEHSLTE